MDAWTIHDVDNHIFDDMEVPVGADKQMIIETIMRKTMGLNVVVNEPRRLRILIKSWSRQRNFVWTRLFNTTLLKYNPIENYNRTEEHVRRNDHMDSRNETVENKRIGDNTKNGNNSDTASDRSVRTPNLTTETDSTGTTHMSDSNSSITHSDNDVTGTHNVWGFNQSEKAPSYEDITEGREHSQTTGNSLNDGENSTQSTVKETGSDTVEFKHDGSGKFDETGKFSESGTEERKHRNDATDFGAEKIITKGNIGVTTTQQMINEERKIALFEISEFISDDFKGEFCILVY